MSRRLLFLLLIVCLLFSFYAFFPREGDPPSLYLAKKGDLELFLVLPYHFAPDSTEVFARGKGVLVPLVAEGEKVEAGAVICLTKGDSTISYQAPAAGIVSTYTQTKNQLLESGDYLFEILPSRVNLTVDLTLEQFRRIEFHRSLQLELPFSPERIWGDPTDVTREGDRWTMQISVMDFLKQLGRQREGRLKVFYGWEKEGLILPAEVLEVEGGIIGVNVRTVANESKFIPVEVRAVSGSQLSIAGITPGEQVIIKEK